MTTHSITISAIIPVYNGEKYIENAIKSVLHQTHPPDEIIVVDDGSVDSTKHIVKSFGDRLRYIYQANKGNGGARNTGIRHARSRYLAFLDADDVWMKDHLENAALFFSRNLNIPWYATATYYTQRGLPKKNVIQYTGRYYSNGFIENYLLAQATCHQSILTTSSVVLSKSMINSINGFSETFKRSVDRICWFELAMISPKIGYSLSPGAIYISTQGSIVHQTNLSEPIRFIQTLNRISQAISRNKKIFRDSQRFIHRTIRDKFMDLLVQYDSNADLFFEAYGDQLNPLESFIVKRSINNKTIRRFHTKIHSKKNIFLGRLDKLIRIYKTRTGKL